MTAFHHHHERHPTDTTTCHRTFRSGSSHGRNCSFDALAQQHRRPVCGLSRDLVQGVADATGCACRDEAAV